MRRLTVCLAFTVACLFASPSAEAITILTSSYVLAPSCCQGVTVKIWNGVEISNSNQMWANEPISHLFLATVASCALTFNSFRETCCVTASGNSILVQTTISNAACPIQARGRSYAWIGGYGSFPYKEHQTSSACVQPCYCDPGVGEDDPWDPCGPEEIFC